MDRREFLGWVGVGGLASSLPLVLAALTTETMEAAGQSFKVGKLADLRRAGFLVIENPRKVIVIRDPADPNKLRALTANCNHDDCTVTWATADRQFQCPCHGSRFRVNGAIARGPATQPLRTLSASVRGEDVWVTV